MEFIRRRVQKMAKVKDILNFLIFLYSSSCCKCYWRCVDISNVPKKTKTEDGTYALIHGTKAALERFNKIYLKFKSIIYSKNIYQQLEIQN